MLEETGLSIIIVTWNSEKEIEKCIDSITEKTGGRIKYEIIITDNNSSDETREIILKKSADFPGIIKLIRNDENRGFTEACNLGIKSSEHQNILLLNPDTIVKESCFEILLRKLYEKEIYGAAAPQLLNEDGSIQNSCRNFPGYFDMLCELTLLSRLFAGSRKFNHWKMGDFMHNKDREVSQPMGAALLIKKTALKDNVLLDENMKMFFSDVDICKRIYDNGYKIIFIPDAKIIHGKGISIYKDRVRMMKLWNEDCLGYFRKNNYSFILYSWLSLSLKFSLIFRIIIYKIIN